MTDELAQHRKAELVQRLRQAGLRVTQPRLWVLDVLDRVSGHWSADEVLAAVRARGARLSRATVYNVIHALVSSGLVMVADAGPGRMLLESARVWHHHFVCRDCGTVIDVPCVIGAKPCLQPALPGAEVDEAQVIWRGRCPRCVARSASRGGEHARQTSSRTSASASDRSIGAWTGG
ncbi:MAG: transcriptional repressor [Thermomicrobium sp.]|nr:transcriptional repressor [Thermomicrobium sp.]